MVAFHLPMVGLFAILVGGAVVAEEPALPFAAGEIRIIEQVGRDGRMSCFVRAEPVGFLQAAAHRCRQAIVLGASAEPIADPAVQTAMVIRVVPEGQDLARPSTESGEILADEEAELIVQADGSMEACRSIRRVDRAEPRPWADGVCNSLRRSGVRPFTPATVGARPVRGTIRVSYYAYNSAHARAARAR